MRVLRQILSLCTQTASPSRRNKAVQHQQRGPTDYADICHVERRPMPACQMEIEKISHCSVMKPVKGIAKRSLQQ